MKKLLVFVEGKYDLIFVKHILYNYFLQKSILLFPITYQKTRNHEVKKNIKSAKSKNTKYLLLSDLDSHTYPCISSRKESRINELGNEIEMDNVIIVKEEIESWILAGIDNRIEEYREFTIPDNTENITKEDFEQILAKTSFGKGDLLFKLTYDFNFNLALKRNQSFNYFLNKCISFM